MEYHKSTSSTMAFKFIAFAAFVAVARAGVISPVATYAQAPLAYAHAPVAVASPILAKTVVDTDFDPNPQYHYAYSVSDALTGDNKHQEESRQGDVVQGSYSLVESDGTRRIVDYTADPINGFNAVVRKEGVAVAAPVVAKVAVAQPAVAYHAAAPAISAYHAAPAYSAYAAPAYSAYAAPAVVKTAYASPVATYIH